MYIMCIYIYIYRERESRRRHAGERRPPWGPPSPHLDFLRKGTKSASQSSEVAAKENSEQHSETEAEIQVSEDSEAAEDTQTTLTRSLLCLCCFLTGGTFRHSRHRSKRHHSPKMPGHTFVQSGNNRYFRSDPISVHPICPIYIYIYIHIYIYIYTHTMYIHTHKHIYIYIYISVTYLSTAVLAGSCGDDPKAR